MTDREYQEYCDHFFDCDDNDDFHTWSDSEYWNKEAQLGAQWHREDHGTCSCDGSGWLLTNIDTWIECHCGGDLQEDDGWPTMTVEQYLLN